MIQLAGLMRSGAMTNLAIGLGVAVVVPVVAGALVPALRPIARGTLKRGILAYEKTRETAAGLAEVVDDLVAEVQEELQEAKDRDLARARDADLIEAEWVTEEAVVESGGKR